MQLDASSATVANVQVWRDVPFKIRSLTFAVSIRPQ
jgi:hypothetical protein